MAVRIELGERALLARVDVRRVVLARLHAAEPFVDIGDEAGLRLLAVIDDVETRRDLAAYDVVHGIAHGLGIGRRMRVAVGHHVRERVGPGQGPDMGGDDAFLAFLLECHGCSSV